MTVIAAVSRDREGQLALVEALNEAKRLGVELVAVNLSTTTLNLADLDAGAVKITVVDHPAKGNETPSDVVLSEIEAHHGTRLVIGVKRRTAVGKAILGSLSQQLLLHAPVPVLAVKIPEDELPSSAFDSLPPTMRSVDG